MSSLNGLVLAALIVALVLECQASSSGPLDHLNDIWNSVVSKHVHSGTLEGVELNVVDYEGIQKDNNFTSYIDGIAKANTTGLDHNSTYAFFMNVYNALAIKMVIDHPCDRPFIGPCHPIKSIKDIGSLLHPVWDFPAGTVGGKSWTLNDVEGFLRDPKPLREDSRLHTCIVCASISCPNVRKEAYQSGKVGEQMDSQVKDFMNNPKKGFSLDRSSNTLTLSPIFLWFVGDFQRYGGVTKFISPYISPSDAAYIANNNPSIHHFSYDWDLNGVPPCTC